MTRVYVGNLDSRVSERDLEDEFRAYGVLRSVWVARRPPGYAFIEFDDNRDALDAIRAMDGKNGWRVELSHNSRGGGRGGPGGGRRGGGDGCYECGEPGHFARECRLRIGPGGMGSGRRRSPSPPRYRRSPSYGRRGYSPAGRSPQRRSVSPRHDRSYSRSRSPYHSRNSPRANGSYSPVGRRSPQRRSVSPNHGPNRGRSYSRSRSLSHSRNPPRANGSYSPHGKISPPQDLSPRHGRSYSRSPPLSHGSPYANGNAVDKDRQQSQSRIQSQSPS